MTSTAGEALAVEYVESAVEMRPAQVTEGDVLRRLAELDSSPELTGQVVIALVDGEAVAGLSLLDHRVVANPFVPTGDAIALLRLRAQQLAGGPIKRRAWRRIGVLR